MSDNSLIEPTPQFHTAEHAGTPGADRCTSCQQGIAASYFRVNGAMTCANCAEQAERLLPKDSHAAYMRGLLFGVGGAILGLVLYSTVGIVTGLMIGYVSLAVGFIVGKAIMKGSGGLGSRRYQIAAALLTYAAVSMSAVPIGISQYIKNEKAVKAARADRLQPEKTVSGELAPADATQIANSPGPSSAPKQSLGAVLGLLLLWGLGSPFLELQDPLHGLIGLVILFVGIRIAWQLAAGRPNVILGPFKNPSPATGYPAAS